MRNLSRLMLLSLALLAWGVAAEEVPDAAPLTAQRITLQDGRRLVGIYDRDREVLVLINEKTGKRQGEIGVRADEIVASEALAIQPQKSLPQGLNGSWLSDYTKARQLAKTHERPLLIDFTGSDWCGWCIKLDKEVFSQKEFKEWAKGRVVLLKLDFPRRAPLAPAVAARNAALAQQFGVTGYPTIHVVDAVSEKSLRQWGYSEGGPKAWVHGLVTGVPGLDSLAWAD